MTVREKRAGAANTYVLTGTVKGAGRAEVVVDKATLALISATANRVDGGSMSLVVTNELFNRPIPRESFRFSIPAGAKSLPDAPLGGIYGGQRR